MANNNYRYTFSLSHSDQDIIPFLENKRKTTSISSYVRNLIRKDMGQATVHDEQFEDMYQYLLRRLQETGNIVRDILPPERTHKPLVDDTDKDLILNLF
ncbi:hypothetical protein [Neobacillus drentensis]|uniref:hypothetical protein n=1 Tax=Neobacillus drentensis TaxID=220684 RepID=UPI002FFE0D57